MTSAQIPHLRWPLTRGGDGKLEVVEQDTTEHVQSCQWAIVVCPAGFRHDRPEFGWPFPTFQNMPLDTAALSRALEEFEPRGHAKVEEWFDVAQQAVDHFEVRTPQIDDTGTD